MLHQKLCLFLILRYVGCAKQASLISEAKNNWAEEQLKKAFARADLLT